MRVIHARNVHEALPKGLQLLQDDGVDRNSRNGPVRMMRCPVTTVYKKPCERVVFWGARDANPAFHLYEALWMLTARRDVEPLTRYAKNMINYSDNGISLHAAYGNRWIRHFGKNQLEHISHRLKADPDDRRSVLGIWDPAADLDFNSKDLPCNLMATLQRSDSGALDLTVFCRSNDIIWGAYGANAVQFSVLQEYLSLWIGCSVGVYNQISVNYHAYTNVLDPLTQTMPERPWELPNPYHLQVKVLPMDSSMRDPRAIDWFLRDVDSGFHHRRADGPWLQTARAVLKAHHHWKTHTNARCRYSVALSVLAEEAPDPEVDWVVAMKEWILRRQKIWEAKQ